MKKDLLTVLTVVISLILLACSFVIWPSLEKMLLAEMEQAVSEMAIEREPVYNPVPAEEETGLPRGEIIESMRFVAWAGLSALDLWRKAMTWGGYGSLLYLWKLYMEKPLRAAMAALGLRMGHGGRMSQRGPLLPVAFALEIGGKSSKVDTLTLSHIYQCLSVEESVKSGDDFSPCYCWGDLWALEQIQEWAEAELDRTGEAVKQDEGENEHIIHLMEEVVRFYKDHPFPVDAQEPLMNACQGRLRSKFVALVIRLGDHLQDAEHYEEASELYQAAIEVDDTVEEFYQNLMECYGDLGRQEEAIAVYHRCENSLAALGIELSPKTTEMYERLLADNRPACACRKR